MFYQGSRKRNLAAADEAPVGEIGGILHRAHFSRIGKMKGHPEGGLRNLGSSDRIRTGDLRLERAAS